MQEGGASSERRVGFATWDGAPALTADDRLALGPLAAHGIAVVPFDWRAGVPAGLDAVVLRSCWDAHKRLPEYRGWLDALEAGSVPVLNPVPVVRWNLDKAYLRELAAGGARLPATAWIARGEAPDLGALLEAYDLDEVVVKPIVSATAWRTWRTSRADAARDQAEFKALVADSAVLVQAFVPEVLVEGEVSLVFFHGAFSHALRKRPAAGDFRVQQDFGGSREPFVPTPRLLAQAEAVLALAAPGLLYARVDGIEVDGALVLMELEVIDPELYLVADPEAPARFAAALAAAVTKRS